MRPKEAEPTFLRLRWEAAPGDQDRPVVLEATLCKKCRQTIDLEYVNVQGLRQRGPSCDLCEGRQPLRV